jgi:hypothetical protein
MANKIETLESLLGKDEPNGTFHDSSLLSINVDYDRKMFIADFDMCVGDPEGKDQQARERYRPGRFRVEGFVFWFMEAPTTPSEKWFACPWLTGLQTALAEGRWTQFCLVLLLQRFEYIRVCCRRQREF